MPWSQHFWQMGMDLGQSSVEDGIRKNNHQSKRGQTWTMLVRILSEYCSRTAAPCHYMSKCLEQGNTMDRPHRRYHLWCIPLFGAQKLWMPLWNRAAKCAQQVVEWCRSIDQAESQSVRWQQWPDIIQHESQAKECQEMYLCSGRRRAIFSPKCC